MSSNLLGDMDFKWESSKRSLFLGDDYSFGFLYNHLSLFLLARGYLNFFPWKPMFFYLGGHGDIN